jgi:hypothetical protein
MTEESGLDWASDSGDGAGCDPFKENLLEHAMRWIKSKKGERGSGSVQEGEQDTADAEEVDGASREKASEEEHQYG